LCEVIEQLKQAIDTNDFSRVQELMTAHPELHRGPLGYGKDGPLTWVAECRVPWEPPSAVRLAMAQWMIENGSDVHQGGDGPLMRAALNRDRVPMMELLVEHGADVNAEWHGDYPILFAACETLNPVTMRWLLEHGADPNCRKDTALDYLIGTYVRSEELPVCIDLLSSAGGRTRFDLPGVMPILRGNAGDPGPDLIHRQFPELNFGSTGARRLLLEGGTLLHVAAEFGNVEAARLLLARGASPNAVGGSGQTPIFHSVSQFRDWGLEVTRLLIDAGADLTVRVKLPGNTISPITFPNAHRSATLSNFRRTIGPAAEIRKPSNCFAPTARPNRPAIPSEASVLCGCSWPSLTPPPGPPLPFGGAPNPASPASNTSTAPHSSDTETAPTHSADSRKAYARRAHRDRRLRWWLRVWDAGRREAGLPAARPAG
jgi:ankyrin repeat protein